MAEETTEKMEELVEETTEAPEKTELEVAQEQLEELENK